MKKLTLAFLVFAILSGTLLSQTAKPFSKNAVYFELFGPGIFYSINYDFRPIRPLALRAGYSNWSMSSFFLFIDGWIKFQSFPLTASYLTGKGNHSLELGLGAVPTHIEIDGTDYFFGEEIETSKTIVLGTGVLGYRYQPKNGKFLRVGFTPLFNQNNFVPFVGASFGFCF
ncbi:hypothetical protein JXA84_03205 [candidate division WOR-3 bacterium]|nr:hypothetical protein [candidate division WOR-3 bacterium]